MKKAVFFIALFAGIFFCGLSAKAEDAHINADGFTLEYLGNSYSTTSNEAWYLTSSKYATSSPECSGTGPSKIDQTKAAGGWDLSTCNPTITPGNYFVVRWDFTGAVWGDILGFTALTSYSSTSWSLYGSGTYIPTLDLTDVTLEPEWPADGICSTIATTTATGTNDIFTGGIALATTTPLFVTDVCVTLTSCSSATSTTFCDDFPVPLESGQASVYMIPVSISASSSNYKVEYYMGAYNASTGVSMIMGHYANGTFYGQTCPGSSCDWANTKYQLCTFPDCSALSWWDTLEKLWCNIEDFGLRLICPNPETLKKSWAILDQLKTTFPYSYMAATKNVLTVNQTYASSGATTTVYGTDVSDFANSGDTLKTLFNVGGFNIITIFYAACSGLLVFAFGFFVIRYIAKEFFT